MRIRWTSSVLLLTQFLLLEIFRLVHSPQAHTRSTQPVLAAKHDGIHILVTCTIDYANLDSEVYFSCPALGTNTDCYQGCKPTKLCPPSTSGLERTECVPHGETVRCQKQEYANGTVTVSLTIDQRDRRLAGRWYCTHAGKDSVPYTVLLQDHYPQPGPELATPPREVVAGSTGEQKQSSSFRSPAVTYSILSILGLSLIINMAFCVRCVLMRSYIDSLNAGESADCIATALCLPSELKKPPMSHKEPLLPRSGGWATMPRLEHTGYGGSYHGPSSMMQQINNPALLMYPHCYAPAGSYRTQTGSQPRLYQPSHPTDIMYNPTIENIDTFNVPSQLVYQPIDGSSGPTHGTPVINGLPSFIRNPSIKMPSPNPSQRCYLVSNSSPSMRRVSMGAENQIPYFIQQQPPIFGGQVVYDDVSALATINQASTGASQNGIIQNHGLPNLTATREYMPFGKPCTHQPDNNNQSGIHAGTLSTPNRNALDDHPVAGASRKSGVISGDGHKMVISVPSAGVEG